MSTIFFRTLIIYVFLVAAMRLGGKRQVGELQVSELVTALLLSEIAAVPIGHDDIPLSFAVIPILTVICLEIIFAYAVTKNSKLKKLFDGNPSIVINRGKLDKAELTKLRLTVEDLITEARLKGVSDIAELEYAIFEDNGKLSVFPKQKDVTKQPGIAHIIISDGEKNEFGMMSVGMDEVELEKRLKRKNTSAGKVFLYTVNDSGEENWIFL